MLLSWCSTASKLVRAWKEDHCLIWAPRTFKLLTQILSEMVRRASSLRNCSLREFRLAQVSSTIQVFWTSRCLVIQRETKIIRARHRPRCNTNVYKNNSRRFCCQVNFSLVLFSQGKYFQMTVHFQRRYNDSLNIRAICRIDALAEDIFIEKCPLELSTLVGCLII